jgi:hypothetical protein
MIAYTYTYMHACEPLSDRRPCGHFPFSDVLPTTCIAFRSVLYVASPCTLPLLLQVYLPLLPEHPGFVISCPACSPRETTRLSGDAYVLHALAYSTSRQAGGRQWIDRRLLRTQTQAAERHGKVTCRQAGRAPSRRRRRRIDRPGRPKLARDARDMLQAS